MVDWNSINGSWSSRRIGTLVFSPGLTKPFIFYLNFWTFQHLTFWQSYFKALHNSDFVYKKFFQMLLCKNVQGWRTWGVRGVLGLPNISRLEVKLQFKIPQFWHFLNQMLKKSRASRKKYFLAIFCLKSDATTARPGPPNLWLDSPIKTPFRHHWVHTITINNTYNVIRYLNY